VVSRLAETLMHMDEKPVLRPGLGRIPHLGKGGERRPWRIVVTLVIVGSMGVLSFGLWLRPSMSTHSAAKSPVSVEAPPPARLVAPSPRERAAALIEDGLTAVRNGEIGAAAAAFREASEIAPRDARAWTNLGVVLIRTGDEAGGVEALRWALSAVSDYAEAHRNLRQGRGPEAARHYRAFRSHSPDDVPGRATVTARLEEIEARRSPE
jgi:cytochrome c-type biogenesis protein CcmH/NrfG